MNRKLIVGALALTVTLGAVSGCVQTSKSSSEIPADNVKVSGGETLTAVFPGESGQEAGYRVSYSVNKDMSDASSTTLFMPCVDLPYTEYEYWNIKTYEEDSMSLSVENLDSGTYYWQVDVLQSEADPDEVVTENLTSGEVTIKNETSEFEAVKTYDLDDGFTLEVDKDNNALLKGEGKCPAIDALDIKGLGTQEVTYKNGVFTEETTLAALTSLRVDEGITSFSGFGNSMIETLILPDSLETLKDTGDYGGFRMSPKLTRVVFGTGLKTIEGHTFDGCTGLMSLVIPEGVEDIGSTIYPEAMVRVVYPSTLTSYNDKLCYSQDLCDIVLGEGIQDQTEINPEFENLRRVVNRSDAEVTLEKDTVDYQEFTPADALPPITWIVGDTDNANITHGINFPVPREYKISYDLADGMSLSGNEVTSYKFQDTVTLPEAVWEDKTFVGWLWEGANLKVGYRSTSRRTFYAGTTTDGINNNGLIGDVTFTPVFEDFTVTGGDKLTWCAKDNEYSALDAYTYIMFYGKKGQDADHFMYLNVVTQGYTGTVEDDGLDAGTYHYTIRVVNQKSTYDDFDWPTDDIDQFKYVPMNDETIAEGDIEIS